MLRSKLASSLLRIVASCSLTAKPQSRRLKRDQRSCGTEQLEVRQLLTGDFVSAERFGSNGTDTGYTTTIDASGNVYTAGTFSGTVAFGTGAGMTTLVSVSGSRDIFVTKTSSAGNFVWAKKMGGSSDDEANGIAVDGSGNVYTTGAFQGTANFDPNGGMTNLISPGFGDIFVSKLNSAGNFVWAKRMGGVGSDVGNGIAVDGSGNVYTTGFFHDTADFNPSDVATANRTSTGSTDIFVSKLDSAGNYVWAKRMGGNGEDKAHGIAIDGSGNVHTTGRFTNIVDFDPGFGTAELTGSPDSLSTFVSKLDSAGNHVWAKGTRAQDVRGIAVSASGTVYTTGGFRGTVDFDPGNNTANLTSASPANNDAFVLKLDPQGNYAWAKRLGGASGAVASGIAFDVQGNVYTTGRFSGTADFDPDGGVTAELMSAGATDIFVSKLDNAGNFAWAKKMGGMQPDEGHSIAVDGFGNIYTTGGFMGTADFDPGSGTANLTSAGANDIFVSKLSPDFLYQTTAAGADDIVLRRNGNNLEIFDKVLNQVTESHAISQIRNVKITGQSNQDDTLTIDMIFGGGFQVQDTVSFEGGTGGKDTIQVMAERDQTATYFPSKPSPGLNEILMEIPKQSFVFSGVESVVVTGGLFGTALKIVTEGNADELSLQSAPSINGELASQVTGQKGGLNIVPITFTRVENFILDTGAGNDMVGIRHGAVLQTAGLKNLTVRTGLGNDIFGVSSTDLRVGAGDGTFSYEGGGGADTFNAEGNTNWSLTNTSLKAGGGGVLELNSVEIATLRGGAGNNILNASQFSGNVTFYGLAGDDTLIGGTGINHVILQGTNSVDHLQLQKTATGGVFRRRNSAGGAVLETDTITAGGTMKYTIQALGGDDVIEIDSLFTELGNTVDGGTGNDTCTAPSNWTRISC
jgi:hypothetical protein